MRHAHHVPGGAFGEVRGLRRRDAGHHAGLPVLIQIGDDLRQRRRVSTRDEIDGDHARKHVHRLDLAGGKESLGENRPEGVFAFGCRVVRLVTLARERAVQFEPHTTRLGRLFHGDCYWLAHAARR